MKVHLRKKKSPSGTHSLFLHYYHGGKGIKEYLGIHIGKKDAEMKDKMLLAEKIRSSRELDILHGNFGMISPKRKKTDIFAFFENFNSGYNKKDLRRFEATLSDLKKFCGYKDQDDRVVPDMVQPLQANTITENFCQRFSDYLVAKHRGATSFNYFKAFRRVLKEAVKIGIYLKNPADGVKNRSSDNKLTKEVLHDDEIALLYRTTCGNKEVKRAFLFACFTGLRSIDVRSLTWNQIDFKRGMLCFDQSKTDEQNYLPLNGTAIALLGKEGTGRIFDLPSPDGTNQSLKTWVKRAKIKKHITFHCARHSFITNLLVHGTDLKTASTAAGHTSTRHTEKYTHISDKMKRKAVDSLPALEKVR